MSKRVKQIVGKKFGNLTALEFAGLDQYNNALWTCKCDCGRDFITTGIRLRSGSTKSCGCSRGKALTTHGESNHRGPSGKLYRKWESMISRCECKSTPNYLRYGARGISVCPRWHDFIIFKKWALEHGYSGDLELDRINNDGNYEPDNCEFVTHIQNNSHRRDTINITISGECDCLSGWARRINRTDSALWRYLQRHGIEATIGRIRAAIADIERSIQ